MLTRNKLVCVGMAAALMLALAVSSASAGRLSLSHRLTRAMFNPLTFSGPFGAAARCPITLESSFHRETINKTLDSLIGYVTRAIRGTCTQGNATILSETLPWHIAYGGFTGSLPRFLGIKQKLIGASFRVQESVFGINCLSRTTTTNPSIGIAEGIEWEANGNGIIRRLVAEPGATIPCGSITGRFEGTATVTDNTGATNVLIRLI